MQRPRARLSPAAALLAGGLAIVLSTPGPIGADSGATLRRDRAALAAHEHRVLLELYALDSRLDSSRRRLESLAATQARLAHERTSLRLRLLIASETLRRARRALAVELRALYEQAEPDALAVVLGATSLRDGLEAIDDLKRSALATRSVIVQSGAARADVVRLRRVLAQRERELRRVRRGVAVEAGALARARDDRETYVGELRRRERIRDRELAALEVRARAAEARAQAATARAATDSSVASFVARAPLAQAQPSGSAKAAAPAPASAGVPAGPGRGVRTIVVVSTGYSLPGTTATGLPVGRGIVAVDPTVIPLGTRMTIPGYGEAVAADTGSAIKGIRVDLWFPTRKEALAWGWQTLTVTLH